MTSHSSIPGRAGNGSKGLRVWAYKSEEKYR